MTRISDAVKRAGIVLSLPLAEVDKEAMFNSLAILNSDGSRVGTFRKMHIPGQPEPKEDGSFTIMEKRYFAPGDLGFGAFDTAVGKVGGLICYDRRFPESYRSVAQAGAEIICVGYNTPVSPGSGRSKAQGRRMSELALRAGAYFTASYVLAAGKAGKEGGVAYIGGSFIADPDGEIIARAKTEGDEIVLAEVDLERVAKARKQRNYEQNRRTDAYLV
jgi:predicted amidohydrolase